MFYRPINDIHIDFDRYYNRTWLKKKPELHETYEPSPLDTDKDTVLGVAGDIGVKYDAIHFLKKMSSRFKAVVAVLGNHDYWRRDLTTHTSSIREELSREGYHNVFLLNRDTVTIDGVLFIGATLWTDYDKGDNLLMSHAAQTMNDYKFMRKLNYTRRVKPNDILGEHIKDRDFIFSHADRDEKMVVLSHHAPCFQSIDFARYGNGSFMNKYYATEFGTEIAYSNFKLWHHGHIHGSKDYMIYQTRVICNPRGYFMYEENKKFNDKWIIEL